MCGIAGAYAWPEVNVTAMVDRLTHRGPDYQAVMEHDGCVHGHARLALVDLTSASNQPFQRDGATLSFVGEIWNYKALRDDLTKAGEIFRTAGDTEVLAAALNCWGLETTLKRAEGMFSFAWSSADGKHVLARDRFGKVPLYIARVGRSFAWFNERKANPRLGIRARALPPGKWLDLVSGKLHCWYRLAPAKRATSLPDDLRQAVADRLAADAEVCCLISGGLDSSIVLKIACDQLGAGNVTAFTVRLDERSPDLAAARRLCSDYAVKLIEVDATMTDREAYSRSVQAIEIASKAQVEIGAMCLPLAEAISAEGFRACLSGEGADEIFGGYGNMCIKASRADDAGWLDIRKAAIAKMARGNFVRCNKIFMAHSVEARLPFLRPSLVESALAMGKKDCPPGKGALKRAAKILGVPEWIIKRSKETFQGAAGSSDRLADLVANPGNFIRAETRSQFGMLAME